MATFPGRWPWYVGFVPAALAAGGLAWNALSPSEYWGDGMVAAACVVAGALTSLRYTVLVGTVITLGIVALVARDGYLGHTAGSLELVNTVFAALVGVAVNLVIARHGHRLAVVRSVAEAAQAAVLPAPPARIGPLAVAACYQAAQTEALIGGDAYAVQPSRYGTRLLIADVRGKGLGAVRAVSVLLGAFRENADRAPDLVTLADWLEQSLLRELVGHEREEVGLEGFITALLGEFSPRGDTLRLLDCGHPAAYLFRDGGLTALESADPGLPLGMSVLGVARSAPDSWPVAVGDTLLLVTDGVTEARNAAGVFYDPLTELSGLGPFRSPDDALDAVVSGVRRWTGGPRDDDMALLALTRVPGPPGA
ncbi:PP2C family protein-serine/threonine phosphatase [Streptantibioticus parmotrematis]|uniref:PP2C family protein-serine/threonine phosphatase n=1 Tax=Streptantibioticus parmotrematis TaxID=2873249 RepID=UPI0033F5F7EA